MLDENRIKEARNNINQYIQDNLIWKIKISRKEILNTYIKNYKESLKVAKKLIDENISNLWVVVVSYYSMYYISNAFYTRLDIKLALK